MFIYIIEAASCTQKADGIGLSKASFTYRGILTHGLSSLCFVQLGQLY